MPSIEATELIIGGTVEIERTYLEPALRSTHGTGLLGHMISGTSFLRLPITTTHAGVAGALIASALLAAFASRVPRDHRAFAIIPRAALVVSVAIAGTGRAG